MSLPNKLTIMRFCLVPVFMVFLVVEPIYNALGDKLSRLAALAIFALASFTDFLDGYIARKQNIVTDFGRFIDPLADKLLVFGALLGVLY